MTVRVGRISARFFDPPQSHGANPRGRAEIERGQSVKGTFRWFFRTVAGRVASVESVRLLDFALNGSPSSEDIEGHASPWSLTISRKNKDELFFRFLFNDRDVYEMVMWLFPYFLLLSGYGRRHRHGYGSFSLDSFSIKEDDIQDFVIEVERRVREFANKKGIRIAGDSFSRFPVLYDIYFTNKLPKQAKVDVKHYLDSQNMQMSDKIRFLGGVRIKDKYSTPWGREEVMGLRERRIPSRILFRRISTDKTAVVLLSVPGVSGWRNVYNGLLRLYRR